MPINLTGTQISSTYGQLLHVSDGPTSTSKTVYSGTGTATALKVATTHVDVDDLRLDGTTLSTTTTNGNLNLAPNGTGSVVIGKAHITGGTLTGITDIAIADGGTGASTAADARTNLGLGTMATQSASAVAITGGTVSGVTFSGSFSGMALVEATTLATSNATAGCNLSGATLAADGTDTNIDLTLTPKGTGEVNISKVDIDSGAIDGTTIGATTAASVKGTTVEATTSIGYPTGTGGTVTQATSRTTGVTLDKITGEITLFGPTTIAGHGNQEFTLTNSTIGANDVVMVCIKSGITAAQYTVGVTAVAAGSCKISLQNINNSVTPSDTPVLQFVVIKGAIA